MAVPKDVREFCDLILNIATTENGLELLALLDEYITEENGATNIDGAGYMENIRELKARETA